MPSIFDRDREHREPDTLLSELTKITYGGTYMCQYCDGYATSAEYKPAESILLWKCDEGHTSYIKEFNV